MQTLQKLGNLRPGDWPQGPAERALRTWGRGVSKLLERRDLSQRWIDLSEGKVPPLIFRELRRGVPGAGGGDGAVISPNGSPLQAS